MQFDIELTPAQVEALAEWTAKGADEQGDGFIASVLLVREGDNIVAGQGDARVRISPAGDTVDHPEPEPIGDRIAREGAAMLAAARDIDYDPAAEDEDGVPIFSDATRAAAQDDPRGERDR